MTARLTPPSPPHEALALLRTLSAQPNFAELAPLVHWVDSQLTHSKDTLAIVEIDKVMLHVARHWPDVPGEAMVVRHVKQMTRMLNSALQRRGTD